MTLLRLFILMTLCFLSTSLFSQAHCKPPVNLKATETKNVPLSASLNWKSIPGVLSYNIKIQDANTENNAPYNVILSSTTNSINVNNFPAKGKYKFRVQSICTDGTSEWSYTGSFILHLPRKK